MLCTEWRKSGNVFWGGVILDDMEEVGKWLCSSLELFSSVQRMCIKGGLVWAPRFEHSNLASVQRSKEELEL